MSCCRQRKHKKVRVITLRPGEKVCIKAKKRRRRKHRKHCCCC